MKESNQKKEDCAHPFYTTEKHTIELLCNIGDIEHCNECKKFYHLDWVKKDHES